MASLDLRVPMLIMAEGAAVSVVAVGVEVLGGCAWLLAEVDMLGGTVLRRGLFVGFVRGDRTGEGLRNGVFGQLRL